MSSGRTAESERSALAGRRVLSVMGRYPWPMDDGWKTRSGNLLLQLARQGATVDLVAFGSPAELAAASAPTELASVQLIPRHGAYSAGKLLAGVVSSTPVTVLNYRSHVLSQRVAELSARREYDLLLIEDVVMAQHVAAANARVKLLDMHNVESHLMQRYADDERRLPQRMYASLTAPKLARYEQHISAAFDGVLVCSEPDGERLRALGVLQPIHVVPNGVDPDFFSPAQSAQGDGSIVFVGSMDYHANISGVQHFLGTILPLIRQQNSDVQFFVVGKNPPERLLALGDTRVTVTGAVDDVRPYLERASVVVVPLTVGGGTRLKILEAMAMGKAIVSTSIGAEGIDVRHGEQLRLADSPTKFATAVTELLADPLGAAALGARAQAFVRATYGWPAIAGEVARAYQMLQAGRL